MTLAQRLRNKITIQVRDNEATDDFGQPIESWTDVCSPWADIGHLNGISAIKANADTSIVQASILIRYRTGLNAGMRAVHGVQVYDIQAILPDEQDRQKLYLVCKVVQ